jgi:hypothetical protein
METSVPAGTVTPLENVNGRNARRIMATWKKQRANQHLVLGNNGEEIQRTCRDTINPQGLPEKTVELGHFVHPSFRPTFFPNHHVDLLAERFDVFRIRKKTVQYLRERLLVCCG